ncbi:hypothetical protein VPHF86_0245 [Vibrio phage F86]
MFHKTITVRKEVEKIRHVCVDDHLFVATEAENFIGKSIHVDRHAKLVVIINESHESFTLVNGRCNGAKITQILVSNTRTEKAHVKGFENFNYTVKKTESVREEVPVEVGDELEMWRDNDNHAMTVVYVSSTKMILVNTYSEEEEVYVCTERSWDGLEPQDSISFVSK